MIVDTILVIMVLALSSDVSRLRKEVAKLSGQPPKGFSAATSTIIVLVGILILLIVFFGVAPSPTL